MKNFHKIAVAVIVSAMAIGFSSFTQAPAKKLVTDWYIPLSSTLSVSDPGATDFSNYNSTPLDEVPTDCSGDTFVCAGEFPNTSQPATAIMERDN